jgi:prepilin-type N-terminal cleavage/methylation domain-containing protein
MRGTARRCGACLQRAGTGYKKGYTLVELLAVTAVLALVLSAVFMFHENILRAFARDTSQVEAQQNARVALDFITSDLRLANWLQTREGGNILDYQLPGENYQWTIRRRPEDNTLLRERRPLLQGGAVGMVDNTVMLASHLTGFNVVPLHGGTRVWMVMVTSSFGGRQFTLESTVSPRNLP